MNKTKLAVIGATLSTAIAIGGYAHQASTALQYEHKIQQVQQETKTLQDELNKSKDEVKQKNNEINKKQKENDDLNQKLKEQDKMLNDLSTDISYNPDDLRNPSKASLAQIKKALAGTTLAGLEEAFFKAERQYGVNAMFLIGLVANESGWGTSPRAREHNNMTGFEVYTPLSRGGRFPSKEESILTTARLLSSSYLSSTGEYHSGYSIWDVNNKYCQIDGRPNVSWSKAINSITYDLVAKVNNK